MAPTHSADNSRSLLRRRVAQLLIVMLMMAGRALLLSQGGEGRAALDSFDRWRSQPANAALSWDETLSRYRRHLLDAGVPPEQADRAMRLALAHDEGTLYDKAYRGVPDFQIEPNRLLVDAIARRTPGKALDVGMGQGRNALFLAKHGWKVSGFDVSAVGLAKARAAATAQGLTIDAVLASDEEFAFGQGEWDLVAILYAIEKRSVFRVREALRPGGLVVVEAAHRDASGGEWEFESNELLHIFAGFKILKYEELIGAYDWAPGNLVPTVRLVAEKPR